MREVPVIMRQQLRGYRTKFLGMFSNIVEKAVLLALPAVATDMVRNIGRKNGEIGAFHTGVNGAPGFFDGGQGDLEV